MALTPTVQVAGQAFPAVTAAPSSNIFATPSNVAVAGQPLAHPSDVTVDLLPVYQEVNVSLQANKPLNMPEYLVMPNQRFNIPTFDPISPIVFQVTALLAPNRVQVSRATKGIIIPALNGDLLPSGYPPSTEAANLLTIGANLLGRAIVMVDRPNFLTPEIYTLVGQSTPSTSPDTSGATTNPAQTFEAIDGAFITAITNDSMTFDKSFVGDPTNFWFILDQRFGDEATSNEYLFAGDFTPDPYLPYPTPVNAPFLGVQETSRPQFSEAAAFIANPSQALPGFSPAISPSTTTPFIPSPPQALPPISETVFPADQSFTNGLAQSFYQ